MKLHTYTSLISFIKLSRRTCLILYVCRFKVFLVLHCRFNFIFLQTQGESTTTNSQDMSNVYTNVDNSGPVTMPITSHAAPLAWPIGNYTLMKPSVGCPGNGVDWKEGSRYHDTENNQTSSRGYVISTNMSGMTFNVVVRHSFILILI